MNPIAKLTFLTSFLCLSILPNSHAQPMSEGLKAYASEDFTLAHAIFDYRFKTSSKQAALMLGVMYINGDGVPADPQTGYAYLLIADEWGDHRAQQYLDPWRDTVDDDVMSRTQQRAAALKQEVRVVLYGDDTAITSPYNVKDERHIRKRVKEPSIRFPPSELGKITTFIMSYLIHPDGTTSANFYEGFYSKAFVSAVERGIRNWRFDESDGPDARTVSFGFTSNMSDIGAERFNQLLDHYFSPAILGNEIAQTSLVIMNDSLRTNQMAYEFLLDERLNEQPAEPFYADHEAQTGYPALKRSRLSHPVPDKFPRFFVTRVNRDTTFSHWHDELDDSDEEQQAFIETIPEIMDDIQKRMRSRRFTDGDYVVSLDRTKDELHFKKPMYHSTWADQNYWRLQAATNGDSFQQLTYALSRPITSPWAQYFIEQGNGRVMAHRGIYLVRHGADDTTIAQGMSYLRRAEALGDEMAIEALAILEKP
ncbi:SEL1-like repeat protein [Aliidiomarina halalkaliphila]|uniref:SEL1-like repeat protein n=1 Tax=Aliidiomarina halalkaliphila TaxID=2593535 RepID=A0A552X3Y5_9GAMM|nr:SEL1-like repeat protein [Aliidiomarina halalkaliphila]TRW49744.1 SEL1-like repeat protein [Aliidiomarina halalkaliphila]